MMLRFSGAGVTDTGKVREHNEDSAFVGPYLALVADGVGGHAAGEVASATTAGVVAAVAAGRVGEPAEDVLSDAVACAVVSLRAGAAERPDLVEMATTLTAVLCDGERVVLLHVGDSRAYLHREGYTERVSVDHTYVQQLVDDGQLSAHDAEAHALRNVVVRYLDAQLSDEEIAPDLVELAVEPGDRLMLCTDGLTDLVGEADIEDVLDDVADAHSAAAVLTDLALEAGGRDNVSVVVVDVVSGPRVVADGVRLGAMTDSGHLLAAVGVPAAR